MKKVASAIIINERRDMDGLTVYELDNVTQWKLIDKPFHSGRDQEVEIWRNGKKHFLQFKGSKEKLVIDEV